MPAQYLSVILNTRFKKGGAIFLCAFLVMIICSRCFIAKNRISDAKAKRWFGNKNIAVIVKDTLIDGRRLHYAVTGNENLPTLVFVHGSPGSWFHYMKFMYDSAMLTKYRMVSIDRPGFGYSNFGKPMHLRQQAALLLRLVETFKNNQPLYIAGHSMGGPVATQMAAYNPQLFTKIVLMAAALNIKEEAKETWRHIMAVKPLFWALPGAFQPSNTELLWLKNDLKGLANDFDKITCAVQFIHGDKDTWVSIRNIGYGAGMMKNASSIKSDTLFGADHQIPWKRREQVRDLLLQLY